MSKSEGKILKPGTRVRIKKREEIVNNNEVVVGMLRYAGKTGTIIGTESTWMGDTSYIIDIAPDWYWLPRSFSVVGRRSKVREVLY